VKIVDRCPSLVQGFYEDVHVLVWRQPLDDEGLGRSLKFGLELAKTAPGGKFWALNVVESGLSLPSLADQRRASDVARQIDPHLRGAAVVLPGEGFWVSAARGFLIGLERLTSLESRREVVATVADGAASIARRSGRGASWASGLERAIASADLRS